MKKICIFCSLPSFNTGMPISTYKLAAGLRDKGDCEVCAVLPGEGELAVRLRQAGVDVTVIPFRRLRANPAHVLGALAGWVRAGWSLFRLVRKRDIGIVHFSDVIDAPFYPFARLAGARVVAHARICAGGPAARCLYRVWAHVFCSRVVAVSEFVKRHYGFGGRAAVVYNPGPDRKIFDMDARRRDAADGGDPAVIAVASFRRDKGHHNFLEIARRVRERVAGGRVRFVIVGGRVDGHGDYYDEVLGKAKRLGLDGCLTVTGNVPHEEVARVMAGADVLVHAPDWEEALGGVVLEAMAAGVTVMAYDSGGVGECFTDGKSGFLVRRGDYDGAADRVVKLLGDKEFREAMVMEARRELDGKFTLGRYVDGVSNIYDIIGAVSCRPRNLR